MTSADQAQLIIITCPPPVYPVSPACGDRSPERRREGSPVKGLCERRPMSACDVDARAGRGMVAVVRQMLQPRSALLGQALSDRILR